MLKFFGGVSSAPDQTTPKASDQRNPFDFFTPSSRKGSVANQGSLATSGGSSGTATAVPSGQATPAQRTSVSTPGVGAPAAASSSSSSSSSNGGGAAPADQLPATPGAVPPTPGGTVRSQPTTGASHTLSLSVQALRET